MLKLLKNLVKINSVYPNEKALSNYLVNILEKNKITFEKQLVENERENILAEKGRGKKSILLYCHLDTINITDGWKTNPLNLIIKNDKAYGLGAWDMKAGLTVVLSAFLNFNPKNIKVKICLCVDEENISKGGHKLIDTAFMNDVSCVISPEPAFFYGLNGVVTGRIGRAVYDVIIEGESKHFAFYEKRFDINNFVGRFLTKLNSLNNNVNKEKKQFVFARKISSETIGMSIPQKTYIQLDSSVLPPNTHKKILTQITNIAKKLNKEYDNYFKISVDFFKRDTPFLEPYQINNNQHLDLLSKSIKLITGKRVRPYFRSSVADENIFGSHGYTVLGIGPIGGNAHAPNEWVSLSSMEKLYNIIVDFLKNSDNSLT